MVSQNRNRTLIRIFLILTYSMLIALIISGVSSLFAYLNTGADRSKMLHTEIDKIEQYLPEFVWTPLANEGRKIDKTTLQEIKNDYLDAWYIRQIAYETNKPAGVKDYYTQDARQNIFAGIRHNQNSRTHLEATTLAHYPTLEFFSEDGKLASLTDSNVVEYKRFFKDEQLVFETTEQATYKVLLLLEDGNWRIRHLVREKVTPVVEIPKPLNTDSLRIKGINYYPKDSPWDMFGDSFDSNTLDADFGIIREAGLNAIRIFVQYEDFGKEKVDPKKLDKLRTTLDIAHQNGLGVVVTLFDFFGDYTVLNWTLNHRHAEQIVQGLKNHPALMAWDIKNEPNLDFESRGKERVIAWLDKMIDLVKSIDAQHPVTIGWSNTQSATILKEKLDIISFHYYEDLAELDKELKRLKKEIPNKPLVMQEFGLSSYRGFWKPFGSSEEDQANYHKKAQEIIAANDAHFMSWTLYDFMVIPTDVVGRLPWRKNVQKKFGFIDENGNKKPAFRYIAKP